MNGPFVICVSNNTCNNNCTIRINSIEYVMLHNLDILSNVNNDISASCLSCGTFYVKAKTIYDRLALARPRVRDDYHGNKDKLLEIIALIMHNITKPVGLTISEYRSLKVIDEPIPDVDYNLEDLLDPLENGNLYELAYDEIAFKIGGCSDVCKR